MLQSDIYNSTYEQIEIDDRYFESRSEIEIGASNFLQDNASKPNQIEFNTTTVQENYLLMNEAYMLFTLEFSRNSKEDIVGSDKFCLRNSNYSIFDSIILQLSDLSHTVEQITFPVHYFNLYGLMNYTDDFAKSVAVRSGYVPHKPINIQTQLSDAVNADSFNATHTSSNMSLVLLSQLIKNNKIQLYCPLNQLPLFNAFRGIWTKCKVKIILKPNYNMPIISAIAAPATGKTDGLTYHFLTATLIIPEVKLKPKYYSEILEKFNKGFVRQINWQSVNIFQSEQIYPVNTTNITTSISSEIKKPSKLYILFTKYYEDNDVGTQKKNTQLYNHFNVKSATLSINNKIAFSDSNLDFDKMQCQRVYERMYRFFLNCKGESLHSGSLISYLEFCRLYRILCYDFSDVDDKSIYNSMGNESISVSFKCNLDANASDKLQLIFIFECEKSISFTYKENKTELSLINV